MPGIFPSGGVDATLAPNAVVGIDALPGCTTLFHSAQCQPKPDPASMNALISETANVFACAGHTYNCNRLDNLCTALTALINQQIDLAPPLSVTAQGNQALALSDPQTTVPNLAVKGQTTPSPLISIAGGGVVVAPGAYLLSAQGSVYFEHSAAPGNVVPRVCTVALLVNGTAIAQATGVITSRVGATGNGITIAAVPPFTREIAAGDIVSMRITASTDGSGRATVIRLDPDNTYITLTQLKD